MELTRSTKERTGTARAAAEPNDGSDPLWSTSTCASYESAATRALRIDRDNQLTNNKEMEMTQPLDSKTVAQRYVAAAQAGDDRAIRDLFARDATWTLAGELPISGVWKGREAIIDEFLATAMSHYQPGSISLEITGMIAERDQVVLQWTSRARTRGGRPYENGCIGVFTIREGKIQHVREYMDTLYAHNVAFSDNVTPSRAVG